MNSEEIARLEAMMDNEKRLKGEGFKKIAGIDEAGRGPLAGPVVAASCILPEGVFFEGLNDSKQLSPEQREILFDRITSCPGIVYGIAKASVAEIDRYNILKATFLAMRRAVSEMGEKPDFLLIDGNQVPAFEFPAQALVAGDALSVSIAAASILAKVTRDRMMVEWDKKWPQYGFKQHKGYATEQHITAILKWGPSPLHRKSFDPVKGMLSQAKQQELFSH